MVSNQVYVYNTINDSLLKKINTNEEPHALELDANGMLWVACSGGFQSSRPALHLIDPSNLEILKTFEVTDINKSFGDIALNSDGTQLYYLLDGLFRIGIDDSALASNPLVSENSRNFYAMDVDPKNDEIYLADAIDYQQRGQVYRYDSSGHLIYSFKVGLIPGFFYFAN
jgi:hypothetical protein